MLLDSRVWIETVMHTLYTEKAKAKFVLVLHGIRALWNDDQGCCSDNNNSSATTRRRTVITAIFCNPTCLKLYTPAEINTWKQQNYYKVYQRKDGSLQKCRDDIQDKDWIICGCTHLCLSLLIWIFQACIFATNFCSISVKSWTCPVCCKYLPIGS